MIHVAAKWTHAFNQDRVLVQLSLQKMSGQGVRTHPPMVLSAMVLIYSVRSFASLFNGGETFWLVMMPLGGGRAIITLRLSEIVGGDDMLSFGCDARECRVLLPEGVRIGERATCPSLGSPDGVAPDSEARHVSSGGGNGRVKNDCFLKLRLLFRYWATWCAGAKRKKNIYDEPPSLGIPRQRVFSTIARLGVWDTEGLNTRSVTVTAPRTSSPFCQFTLGFLLPPCAFCGLPILVCGRAKGWDGDAGDVSPTLKIFANKDLCRLAWLSRAAKMRPERSCGKSISPLHPIPAYIHPNMSGVWVGYWSIRRDRFPQTGSRESVGRKAFFDRLNKLFEITAAKRHHRRHRETCYKTLLNEREEKGKKELWKTPVLKRSRLSSCRTPMKEEEGSHKGNCNKISSFHKWSSYKISGSHEGIIISSPAPSGLPSEATSVYQPGSSPPDVDVVGASCAETLPPMAPPMEETGAERQGLPPCESSSLALDRLLETIEVSCSSAQENHPEGSETEMAEDNPTDPVLVPDEACTSASPFSYAELGEMLKRIPSGSDVAAPSAKIGIRGMVQQHDLLQTWWISDHMKAFVSQRMSGEEELRSRLEQAEASLSAARRASEESVEALKRSQDDNEALRIELVEAKSREEATDARLHEAENETAQLRGSETTPDRGVN
ncbi:hypothetical protein AAG906_022827 [Vitis piasezkii]